MLYVITRPIFNHFRTFELLFSQKYTKEIKDKQNKRKRNGLRMSPCCNVLLIRMRNDMLFKTVILELMQSICAVDGKFVVKAWKTIQIFKKNLNFCIKTTPSHFLKFWSSGPHRSPPCYNILLFMLIGLTKLKFLWAREAVARWGTIL